MPSAQVGPLRSGRRDPSAPSGVPLFSWESLMPPYGAPPRMKSLAWDRWPLAGETGRRGGAWAWAWSLVRPQRPRGTCLGGPLSSWSLPVARATPLVLGVTELTRILAEFGGWTRLSRSEPLSQ